MRFRIVLTILVVVFLGAGYLSLTGRPLPDLGLSKFSGWSSGSVDLDGKWVSDDANPRMTADIDAGKITVNLLTPDSHMVYWYGSFENPKNAGDTVVSNVVEIDILTLSTATSKEFTYKDDKLYFEISAMGVTKTVAMSRE